MCSTHNEGKFIVAVRFISTLENKIYKYMTSISKNMFINKLNNIVDKYNNTYDNTIRIKSVDVKSSTYIDFYKQNSTEHPKFKVDDHPETSKYKKLFSTGHYPSWSEDIVI